VLAACAAVPALAQDLRRLPLVGVLRINSVANTEPTATLLRDELAALGNVDGKNIRLDFRLAEGDTGRFPELAEALVGELDCHCSAQPRSGAGGAARSIPIVAAGNDLVVLIPGEVARESGMISPGRAAVGTASLLAAYGPPFGFCRGGPGASRENSDARCARSVSFEDRRDFRQ
jgi:hypothetical protein